MAGAQAVAQPGMVLRLGLGGHGIAADGAGAAMDGEREGIGHQGQLSGSGMAGTAMARIPS
ncbi:hypothetical protein ACFQU7_00050 [Pseudoroseomonas wenyumeiae]